MEISRSQEIRHLSPVYRFQLSRILDEAHSWKKLMRVIPKTLNRNNESLDSVCRYTEQDIKVVEDVSNKQNRSATEILLDEWGTSGKVRPSLNDLLQLLIFAELFRAADYVAVEILKGHLPERPKQGPAARIDISLSFLCDNQLISNPIEEITYPKTIRSEATSNRATENNVDYYDKFHIGEIKKVCLSTMITDLMKFSETQREEVIPDAAEIQNTISPTFSGLNINNQVHDSNNTDLIPSEEVVSYNGDCITSHGTDTVPDLSILHCNISELSTQDRNRNLMDNSVAKSINSSELPNLSIFGTRNVIKYDTVEPIPTVESKLENKSDSTSLPCLSILENN